MARVLRQTQTNFAAGEINTLLATRTDSKAYYEGAKQLRNFALLAEGGIMRRPGTTYKQTLNGESRIIPFVFSEDELAILAFSNNRLDVYGVDGSVIQSNITTNCNWTTAQLFQLNFTQFGDTVYITHRDNKITKIFRSSASTYEVSLFAFSTDEDVVVSGAYKTNAPFYKYEAASTTLSINTAATGTGRIITSNVSFFTTDYIGHYLKIDNSQVKITGYTSGTVVTGTVIETIAGGTGPHFNWEEETISLPRGYPQAVCFHDNRLWFAGMKSRPSGLLASVVSEFLNFSIGSSDAADAIDVDISGDQVNEVRHLVSSKNLQIFTDGGEFYIPSSSDTSAITPSNITARQQTPYGCNRTRPLLFDQASMFVQKNGRTIREFIYSDLEAGYKSTSVSILAAHLMDNPKEATVLNGNLTRPEQYGFFLNNGSTLPGTLAVFHSVRDEKIAGWVLWSTRTNDEIYSIAAINEYLYCVCKRVLDSVTTYTLEQFGEDDSVSLDCQTTTILNQRGTPLVNGASQTGSSLEVDGFTSSPKILETFTIDGNLTIYTIQSVTDKGLGNYTLYLDKNLAASPVDDAAITLTKGFLHDINSVYGEESINAVFGNSSLGSFTINASDQITLINAPRSSGVKVGFNYTPIMETMPIDKELPTGPLTAQVRRISKVYVDIFDSLNLNIKAADKTSKNLIITQLNFNAGDDLQKVSGKQEFNFLGYDKNPTITISQSDPLPLKILGLAMEVVFA
jgi:hypothetical protein